MQSYAIFNKHNTVFIAKDLIENKNFDKRQTIHCNSEILNSYDFTQLFEDHQKRDYLILTASEDISSILDKVTYGLHFVKAAGGIVRNEDGDYLFMLRNGFWDLPKGHCEEGETTSQTAEREVLEECGMKRLQVRNYLGSSFHSYVVKGKREIKQTYWYNMYCSVEEDLIPQIEEGIQQIVWIKDKDLTQTLKQSYPNIRYLFKTIGKNF